MVMIVEYFRLVSVWLPIMPFLMGIFYFRRLPWFFQIITLVLLMTFCVEFISGYRLLDNHDQIILKNYYALLSKLLFAGFYWLEQSHSIRRKTTTVLIFSFLFLTMVVSGVIIDNLHSLPKYSRLVYNIVMVILATRSVIINLFSEGSSPVKMESLLFFNLAILVFFGGTGFTYLVVPALLDVRQYEIIRILWFSAWVLNLVAYTLITIGLWKARKILS